MANFGSSRYQLFPLVFTLALVLTACGGDSDGQATATTEAATATTQAATATTEQATATTEADIAEAFADETITIVVGSSPGGGFDFYARLMARHLGEHIPGQPNVIVENMPGAGHMIAMNHVYNAAAKDGTVIGNVEGALAMRQLLGSEGVEFDFRDIQIIGQPDPKVNDVLLVRSETGIDDFEMLLDGESGAELIVGIQQPGSSQADAPILMRNLLDANLELVPGYEGTSDFVLAMEQGEIDAFWVSPDSIRQAAPDKFESGEWIPIVGMVPDDDPAVAGVPILRDFATTDEQQAILDAILPTWQYLRLYFVAPEVPEPMVEALREAYRLALGDEDLLAEAEEAGREIAQVDPQEMEAAYQALLNLSDEMRSLLAEALVFE